jgi:hypothetical protein
MDGELTAKHLRRQVEAFAPLFPCKRDVGLVIGGHLFLLKRS